MKPTLHASPAQPAPSTRFSPPDESSASATLYDLHRRLRPQIEQLRLLADAADAMSPAELRRSLADTERFVRHRLRGLGVAEEQVLVPVVEWLMGTPRALRSLACDLTALRRLGDELAAQSAALGDAAPTPLQLAALRRVLGSLHAVVNLHVAKIDQILLPLANARLDAASAVDLARRMHEAAELAEHDASA